jgi:hypothetical protein
MIVKCRSAVVKSAVFWPNWDLQFGRVYDLSVVQAPSVPFRFLSGSLWTKSRRQEVPSRKGLTQAVRLGSNSGCKNQALVLSATSPNSTNTFFA